MPELAYMITCISHTGSVITKIKQVPNLFYSGSQRMMKLFLKKMKMYGTALKIKVSLKPIKQTSQNWLFPFFFQILLASNRDFFVLCLPLSHQLLLTQRSLKLNYCHLLIIWRNSKRRYSAEYQLKNYLANTVPLPPGNVYGCCLRNTWPTLLQGMISRLPPHCQTRNEISAVKI